MNKTLKIHNDIQKFLFFGGGSAEKLFGLSRTFDGKEGICTNQNGLCDDERCYCEVKKCNICEDTGEMHTANGRDDYNAEECLCQQL